MERMIRAMALLAVGIAILGPVLVRPMPASACYCLPRPPRETVTAESVVFRGTLTSIGASDDGATAYVFQPTTIWRGELPDPAHIYDVGGSCSAALHKNGDYVLSVGRDQWGDLRVSSCHLIRDLAGGPLPDDLKFLGEGIEPGGDISSGLESTEPREDASPRLERDDRADGGIPRNVLAVSLAAAAVVLTGAGLIAFRRR